jgi:hypothetical protein
MKRSALFQLVLVSMTVVAIQRASAASAVAIDPHGRTTRVYGIMFTAEEARQNALQLAQKLGYKDARILASTSRYGYCAIALAYKADGQGALMGVSLGNRSQAEADRRAIASCLKAGGYEPRVYARFKG